MLYKESLFSCVTIATRGSILQQHPGGSLLETEPFLLQSGLLRHELPAICQSMYLLSRETSCICTLQDVKMPEDNLVFFDRIERFSQLKKDGATFGLKCFASISIQPSHHGTPGDTFR